MVYSKCIPLIHSWHSPLTQYNLRMSRWYTPGIPLSPLTDKAVLNWLSDSELVNNVSVCYATAMTQTLGLWAVFLLLSCHLAFDTWCFVLMQFLIPGTNYFTVFLDGCFVKFLDCYDDTFWGTGSYCFFSLKQAFLTVGSSLTLIRASENGATTKIALRKPSLICLTWEKHWLAKVYL